MIRLFAALCLLATAMIAASPAKARTSPFAEDQEVCPYNTETHQAECGSVRVPSAEDDDSGTVTPGGMVSTNPGPGTTIVIPTVPIEPTNPQYPPETNETATDAQDGQSPFPAGDVISEIGDIWIIDPTGFDGIGPVPGPVSAGQAIVGIALPGAVIILVNTLAGFPGAMGGGGGGTPVPGPMPQPVPPAIDEEAERRARWLKDREEDLRQVREQKSYLAATATGARQGGFNTAEHDRQIEDLTRRERQLERDIASSGGDTSYVAKTRDTVKVDAGFIEANRIAQEFSRQQALAAARAKLAIQLEKWEDRRAKTAADYVKDVREGFWDNTTKDVDSITPQIRAATTAAKGMVTKAIHDLGEALTDPVNWKCALKAGFETVRELATHPVDSAGKVGSFYGGVGKAAAGAVHHVVTHPIETIKSVTGIESWEKAFDPNVPVTERMVRAVMGTFETAATVIGIKQVATAGKAAIEGIIADGLGAAERLEAAERLRAAARQAHIGTGKYKVLESPEIRVAGSDGLYAGSKDGLMAGVTEKSHRQIQGVCKRYNVKLDVRPTTKYSHDLIAEGKAVPKAEHCKSKTINPTDVLLGAKEESLGLAGHFEPKLPPRGGMSSEKYDRVLDRYMQRMEEFHDQERHYQSAAYKNKVFVHDGVVHDMKTGLPYTGDHDVLEIRDAFSGKPLPRYVLREDGSIMYDWNGRPLLNPERERIIRELNSAGVEHGAHLDWEYSHLSKTGTGTAKSEYDIAQGIDKGVLSRHTQDGGEPLITYSPDGPPVGSWFVGSR